MRRVAVVDGNILTALGDLEQTWDALLERRSGLVKQKLKRVAHELPLGTITSIPGELGSWLRLQALFDELFQGLKGYDRETMLFCASTKGAVDELVDCREAPEGQPWQMAKYLSEQFGLVDRGSMASGACASGLVALTQAAMAIRAGRCDRALVVAFDLLAEFVCCRV